MHRLAAFQLLIGRRNFLTVKSFVHHAHIGTILLQLLEEIAHLSEVLVDLSHRAQLFNVVCLSRQVVACSFLDLVGLLGRIRLRADDAAVGDRVMHRKFLLELAHFLLVSLDQ